MAQGTASMGNGIVKDFLALCFVLIVVPFVGLLLLLANGATRKLTAKYFWISLGVCAAVVGPIWWGATLGMRGPGMELLLILVILSPFLIGGTLITCIFLAIRRVWRDRRARALEQSEGPHAAST
ncbi:hypothetical protein [Mitsuaria sp. GD03876]|uniref:hypothetical protein n=1 Tax=Mitsuaria sp. GD03876 TaxID=2975399 RepID=UPI00244BE8BF|nr:hypothetical protein [Mitsuaria sp. GD03876]MDH0867373.1 hypothetical protein [Mitsuaria sp. GD03876]